MPQYRKILVNATSEVLDADSSMSIKIDDAYDLPDTTSPISDLTDELDTISAELPEIVKYQNGVKALEGELIISKKDDVDFSIDIDGNLVVLHQNADKYSIDTNGDLIYTF